MEKEIFSEPLVLVMRKKAFKKMSSSNGNRINKLNNAIIINKDTFMKFSNYLTKLEIVFSKRNPKNQMTF